MDKEMLENLSLERLAEGAISLLFLEVLSEKILPNIFDPNTDPKKERSMTFEVKFRPTTDRYGEVTGADILVPDPKVKLAPRGAIQSHVLLGKIEGEYQAKEIKQLTIDGEADEIKKDVQKELTELGKQGIKLEVIRR